MEQQQQQQDEADMLRQFRSFFAPILDDSLQLYYQLNEQPADEQKDENVQHIRIHRTMAELLEFTSSEEETLITQLAPPSQVELELELPAMTTPTGSSSISSTSSSCLYAIHEPSPVHPRLESPQSVASEPLTITEQVQLHAAPLNSNNNNSNNNNHQHQHHHNNNNNNNATEMEDEPSSSHNNNNTSCSLSSTLTDSKTLDARSPIVV